MKKQNKDLASLSKEDLNKRIIELKKELIKVRGQGAVGSSQKNPYVIKNNKKAVARIMTVLNKKRFENKVEEKKEKVSKEKIKEEGKKNE